MSSSSSRQPVFFNESLVSDRLPCFDTSLIGRFHQGLAAYSRTALKALPAIATELGVKAVYIKDESNRLGLPSFKILGASWGTFYAISKQLQLPLDIDIEILAVEAQKAGITLYAATDGNHGRAVAYMAKLLSLPARIYVPRTMSQHTRDTIIAESATVDTSAECYDAAVQQAFLDAQKAGGIFIQDTSFESYEDIPAQIVKGYSTMFREIDEELTELGLDANLVISPVGVGSLAHAAVQHYKSQGRLKSTKVVTVEPDTAACLYRSFLAGSCSPIRTTHTIMSGLDCGSVSETSWADLQAHIDASCTISDHEAHLAVEELKDSLSIGPCSAAGLAALRFLSHEDYRKKLDINASSVVILLNTEGERPYDIPHDVSSNDPVVLAQILTQIKSTNPGLSLSGGTGGTSIANYIEAWLLHRGYESHRLETKTGCPSVVGVVRGSGGGKTLMINGHFDKVSLEAYTSNPLSGRLTDKDGRKIIEGRGCPDMKAGVATGMAALSYAARHNLPGDVVLAAVADEENASHGTEEVLEAGWRADGAVITEPSGLTLIIAQKGFVWIEIEILGIAAHGSRSDLGIDSIMNTALVLTPLKEYASSLPIDEMLGKTYLHRDTIQGGEELSSYPASCKLGIEFRTIAEQSTEQIVSDLSSILHKISEQHKTFKYREPRVLLQRPSLKVCKEEPFVRTAATAAELALQKPPILTSDPSWCDAALLSQAGIPTIVFGPSGEGLHAKGEWVDVDSIKKTTSMLEELIARFCG